MMSKTTKTLLAVAAATAALAFTTPAGFTPAGADREAVERAVRDYVEALYEVKPELIERSVHPELVKYGFWRGPEDAEYRGMPMTRAQLVELAGDWNSDGEHANADSPKKIEILDLLDQTAAVKLTAEWGIDYMHLARYDGKWKIVHVLWQSHPRTDATR